MWSRVSDSSGGEGERRRTAALSAVAGPQPLLGVCGPVGSVPHPAVEGLWASTVAQPSLSSRGRHRQPEPVERSAEMSTPAHVETCFHNRYAKMVVMETVLSV